MISKAVLIPVCVSFFAGAVLAGFVAPKVANLDLAAMIPASAPTVKTPKVIPVNERIDTPFKPAREGVTAASPVTDPAARNFIEARSAYLHYSPPHEINDFAFHGPDGEYRSLADFKGRYVLFNLWATWCGYCLEELPSIGRLKEKLAGTNMDVVAISIEDGGSIPELETFLKFRGLGDFALNYDYDGDVKYALPASVLPVTFIVDPDGKVVYSIGGTATWDSPEALAFLETVTTSKQ